MELKHTPLFEEFLFEKKQTEEQLLKLLKYANKKARASKKLTKVTPILQNIAGMKDVTGFEYKTKEKLTADDTIHYHVGEIGEYVIGFDEDMQLFFTFQNNGYDLDLNSEKDIDAIFAHYDDEEKKEPTPKAEPKKKEDNLEGGYKKLVAELTKKKIPCKVKLGETEIDVELGWNYPDRLADKVFDAIEKLKLKKVEVSADTLGGKVIDSTRIAGGAKRY